MYTSCFRTTLLVDKSEGEGDEEAGHNSLNSFQKGVVIINLSLLLILALTD